MNWPERPRNYVSVFVPIEFQKWRIPLPCYMIRELRKKFGTKEAVDQYLQNAIYERLRRDGWK